MVVNHNLQKQTHVLSKKIEILHAQDLASNILPLEFEIKVFQGMALENGIQNVSLTEPGMTDGWNNCNNCT